MKFILIFIFLFSSLLLFLSNDVLGSENKTNTKPIEIVEDDWDIPAEPNEDKSPFSTAYYYNFSAYYANSGVVLNLTDQPVDNVGEKSEAFVYYELLKRSFVPRFLLFELSVNPMPILGTYLRERQNDFYETADYSDINLLESVTAGFEEPYALSLFLNNMVSYQGESDAKGANIGFMGYLLSAGNFHIQRNRLIKDNWIELEWKLKGDIEREGDVLRWSFRVGSKFHQNQNISDIVYIALKRSQIARTGPIFSWLFNSGFEATYVLNQSNMRTVEYQLILSKKIPLHVKSLSLSLDFGVIYETSEKYRGELAEQQEEDQNLLFVLRPSIDF